MKRFFRLLLTIALCAVVSNPQMEARGRNNNGGNNSETPQRQHSPSRTQRGERPNNNGRPNNNNPRPNNNNPRPNTTNNRPNNNNRPNPGNGRPNNNNPRPNPNNVRPGNNGNQFGNHPSSHRPNQPGPGHQSPGPNHIRPINIGHVPHHAPQRPMLPPPVHYCPPPPPPHFRPAPGAPRFGTILGIALGSAITYTIQELINTGYNVCGYTNNAVYVNDAIMLNMMWPNSTLYYNNGRLSGSEFVYSTKYYDTARYYSTYNSLVRTYGAPVTTSTLPGGGMNSTWFGYDGRYVTLEYTGATAVDGVLRYFTTLSFGC